MAPPPPPEQSSALHGHLHSHGALSLAPKVHGADQKVASSYNIVVVVWVQGHSLPLGVSLSYPTPPCESNALVRATVGAVSATFGTTSYFVLYKYHPLLEQQYVFVSVKFRDFSVALVGGMGVRSGGTVQRGGEVC